MLSESKSAPRAFFARPLARARRARRYLALPDMAGVAPSAQRLAVGGVALADDDRRTLAECGLGEGATVELDSAEGGG